MKNNFQTLYDCWEKLYAKHEFQLLDDFVNELGQYKTKNNSQPLEHLWYKDVVVYSLYVNLFNETFDGLATKLDYLEQLGINCLWLLPVLESPMKDGGFDVSDYRNIRKSLCSVDGHISSDEAQKQFAEFVALAHKRGFKIIFDLPLNHCSDEHNWFKAAKNNDETFKNYFIWSENDKKFADARIIFKGIEESNWQKCNDEYYFHRFFEFQPDLNYKNPKVLLEITRIFIYWLQLGVDGFRADAIPYLWKENNTNCENLEGTHIILQFIKSVIDHIRPNTLLLAEACQKPNELARYFANADECNAAYHFPLMPMIFKSIALQSCEPIISILNNNSAPEISEESQWFLFLRCHDELSLEHVYVSEDDRKFLHNHYCRDLRWDFRSGEGIAARLSELMNFDEKKILLAYSILLSLRGTPIIFYGDEFAKPNDTVFYNEQIAITGKNDTRFLTRGKIDWLDVEQQLADKDSVASKVFAGLSKMIAVRNAHKAFGRGSIECLDVGNAAILAYIRVYDDERILVLHNLSEESQSFFIDGIEDNNIAPFATQLAPFAVK